MVAAAELRAPEWFTVAAADVPATIVYSPDKSACIVCHPLGPTSENAIAARQRLQARGIVVLSIEPCR